MINPKGIIKDEGATHWWSPCLWFVTVGLVSFGDGNSSQKWLDAEPMLALGSLGRDGK